MLLREYQRQDVDKLLQLKAAGVFNEQRTGKTPTALTTMKEAGVDKLLIVCPASLVYQWEQEVKLWYADTPAYIITSATKFSTVDAKRITQKVIIVNYENLRDNRNTTGAWKQLLKWKPQGLIVDEAHRCKGRDTFNTKAINKLHRIEHRLYLTGTPAPNKPWDIYPILWNIDCTKYSSYWNFINDYFITAANAFGGTEINTFLPGADTRLANALDEVSVMRKRKDVMPWLPKQDKPTVIKLPLTPSQKKYIQQLMDTFECEHINTSNVLTQLVRTRQICTDPGIVGLRGSSPKTDWVLSYISDYPEKQLIIFSNSTQYLIKLNNKLKENKIHNVLIIGATPLKHRQTFVNDFQLGRIKYLLIQTQAGKEGLTLDSADATIFIDTYPPAADYMQAKDRMIATQPNRVKPQDIIHLMMADTYDEQLYNLVDANISTNQVINDYINYIKDKKGK